MLLACYGADVILLFSLTLPLSRDANHDFECSRKQHRLTLSNDKDTTKITSEHNTHSQVNDAAPHVYTVAPLKSAQAFVDHHIRPVDREP
jgi:hypothetical protein